MNGKDNAKVEAYWDPALDREIAAMVAILDARGENLEEIVYGWLMEGRPKKEK